MKKCPKCRSQHFDGADLCDCGYSFSTGQVDKAKRNPSPSQKNSRGWLTGAGTLVAMLVAGNFLGKMVGTEAASAKNKLDQIDGRPRQKIASSAPSRIQTFLVRQDATGYSNSDLDPQVLQRIEGWLIDGAVEKARSESQSQGYDPSEINRSMYTTSSRLVELDGKKFGVVDMTATGINMKTVLTIQGREFVRVNCIRTDNGEIPLTWGPCADKVEETFKVRFPGAE